MTPDNDQAAFLNMLARQNGSNYGGMFDFLGKKTTTNYLSMPTLSRGSKGVEVQQAQDLLGIATDGDFGPNTEGAVKAKQASAGLPQTGVIDGATWAALLGEEYKGTAAEIQGKKAQTAQTLTDIAGAATGIVGSLTKKGGKKGKGGAFVPSPIPPADTGWGTTEYAMVAGGVLLLGVGAFAIYKMTSK